MKFMQLGNGGAFNFKMPKTSFLFELDEEYLLFDCGTDIFNRLMTLNEDELIDIRKLKTIFISHMDDDHIGSLRTLLYHQFFIHGIIPKVICSKSLYPSLKTYLVNICKHNGIIENYEKKYSRLFDLYEVKAYNEMSPKFNIDEIRNKHYQPGSGIMVKNSKERIAVIISGDTIACKELLEDLKKVNREFTLMVFHDYSPWDQPDKQVHACKTNIEEIYPEYLSQNLNWYHNNEPFLSGWIELSELIVVSNYKIINENQLNIE
jgi:ribonuclease BN (tRNA processing enzyme)